MVIVIAQIIGIAAMIVEILSYQAKTHRGIVTVQILSTLLYSVNIFMLSGVCMGFILNIIGIFRSIVFSNKKFFKADNKIWVVIFIASYLVSYVLLFTVFGVEPMPLSLFMEFLPIVGMISTTIGFYMKHANAVRVVGLINSPCWFVYHFYNGSIGGTLSSVIIIFSILIGMFRFRNKEPGEEKERNEN